MDMDDMAQLKEAGKVAYQYFHRLEVSRFKVLRHCNLLPRTLANFSPPQTRGSNSMHTAQLISACSVCHERHISITHKSYLTHYTALPFNCEHGHRIEDMAMVEPESRTKPFINLPADIRRLAPECLSESSGGQITNDKLDADKQRLQEAFNKADEAFQALALIVATTGVSTQNYPQFSTDHVNFLLAAMESNVDDCNGYIDAQKENLSRLAEVDEADSLRISDQGVISVNDPNARVESQQIDLGIGDGLLELAAATQPDQPSALLPNIMDSENPEAETSQTSSSTSMTTVTGNPGSMSDNRQTIAGLEPEQTSSTAGNQQVSQQSEPNTQPPLTGSASQSRPASRSSRSSQIAANFNAQSVVRNNTSTVQVLSAPSHGTYRTKSTAIPQSRSSRRHPPGK